MTIQNITLTRAEVPPKDECGPDCVCTCGKNPASTSLDLRAVAVAERSAELVRELRAVAAGASLDLIAGEDPVAMLDVVEAELDGVFLQRYVEQGPERWLVRLTHR